MRKLQISFLALFSLVGCSRIGGTITKPILSESEAIKADIISVQSIKIGEKYVQVEKTVTDGIEYQVDAKEYPDGTTGYQGRIKNQDGSITLFGEGEDAINATIEAPTASSTDQ